MFPLGTALLPGGELPLRVFEPRYRQMVGDHIEESDGRSTVRFGVVLIARGSEVGGGEVRCEVGTMTLADVTDRLPDGRALLSGTGTHRFRIVEWLPDDPYPRARIEVLPEPAPSEVDLERLARSIDQLAAALSLTHKPTVDMVWTDRFLPAPGARKLGG